MLMGLGQQPALRGYLRSCRLVFANGDNTIGRRTDEERGYTFENPGRARRCVHVVRK
jgi:hypothetical protein